jgi:hypothetical protein
VVCPETLRLLMALCLESPDVEVEQLDVVTAFLYGSLDENIYMNTPRGQNMRSKVVHLLKSLYGLKQAPRNWHEMIDKFLVEQCGFTKIKSTQCLYVKRNEINEFIILALYVDDLTLVGSNLMISETKTALKARFDITDLGSIKTCVGIQVDQGESHMLLHQSRFVNDLLKATNMGQAHPVPTPATPYIKLSKEMCPTTSGDQVTVAKEEGKRNYRSVVQQPPLAATYQTRHFVRCQRTFSFCLQSRPDALYGFEKSSTISKGNQ